MKKPLLTLSFFLVLLNCFGEGLTVSKTNGAAIGLTLIGTTTNSGTISGGTNAADKMAGGQLADVTNIATSVAQTASSTNVNSVTVSNAMNVSTIDKYKPNIVTNSTFTGLSGVTGVVSVAGTVLSITVGTSNQFTPANSATLAQAVVTNFSGTVSLTNQANNFSGTFNGSGTISNASSVTSISMAQVDAAKPGIVTNNSTFVSQTGYQPATNGATIPASQISGLNNGAFSDTNNLSASAVSNAMNQASIATKGNLNNGAYSDTNNISSAAVSNAMNSASITVKGGLNNGAFGDTNNLSAVAVSNAVNIQTLSSKGANTNNASSLSSGVVSLGLLPTNSINTNNASTLSSGVVALALLPTNNINTNNASTLSSGVVSLGLLPTNNINTNNATALSSGTVPLARLPTSSLGTNATALIGLVPDASISTTYVQTNDTRKVAMTNLANLFGGMFRGTNITVTDGSGTTLTITGSGGGNYSVMSSQGNGVNLYNDGGVRINNEHGGSNSGIIDIKNTDEMQYKYATDFNLQFDKSGSSMRIRAQNDSSVTIPLIVDASSATFIEATSAPTNTAALNVVGANSFMATGQRVTMSGQRHMVHVWGQRTNTVYLWLTNETTHAVSAVGSPSTGERCTNCFSLWITASPSDVVTLTNQFSPAAALGVLLIGSEDIAL